MKTNKKEKEFDTVKTFREIKEKIAQDLIGMNFEQIKAYFKANSLKFQQQ
jgi:beta-lactam-binding protein with PASTA domain